MSGDARRGRDRDRFVLGERERDLLPAPVRDGMLRAAWIAVAALAAGVAAVVVDFLRTAP